MPSSSRNLARHVVILTPPVFGSAFQALCNAFPSISASSVGKRADLPAALRNIEDLYGKNYTAVLLIIPVGAQCHKEAMRLLNDLRVRSGSIRTRALLPGELPVTANKATHRNTGQELHLDRRLSSTVVIMRSGTVDYASNLERCTPRSETAMEIIQLQINDSFATLEAALNTAFDGALPFIAAQPRARHDVPNSLNRVAEQNTVQPETLSARELEVCLCAVQGMSNQQIADHLSIGITTVKTHLKASFSKLGLDRRTQLWQTVGSGFPQTTNRSLNR